MGQVSIVSAEARKALDAETYRSNAVKRSVWVGDVLWTEFIYGQVTRFNRRLISAKLRERAEVHGLDQKIGDACAVKVEDFPDKRERVAEAVRRQAAVIEHLESGGDDWNPPRRAAPAYVPTEGDVSEVLERLFGEGKATVLMPLTAKLCANADGSMDAKAALAHWTTSKEGAAAWAGIQAERRRTGGPSADEMLATMMRAAGAPDAPDAPM